MTDAPGSQNSKAERVAITRPDVGARCEWRVALDDMAMFPHARWSADSDKGACRIKRYVGFVTECGGGWARSTMPNPSATMWTRLEDVDPGRPVVGDVCDHEEAVNDMREYRKSRWRITLGSSGESYTCWFSEPDGIVCRRSNGEVVSIKSVLNNRQIVDEEWTRLMDVDPTCSVTWDIALHEMTIDARSVYRIDGGNHWFRVINGIVYTTNSYNDRMRWRVVVVGSERNMWTLSKISSEEAAELLERNVARPQLAHGYTRNVAMADMKAHPDARWRHGQFTGVVHRMSSSGLLQEMLEQEGHRYWSTLVDQDRSNHGWIRVDDEFDEDPRLIRERDYWSGLAKSHEAQIVTLNHQLAAALDSARLAADNTSYYQNIVRKIGALFGSVAYTADDGGVHDEVLSAKVFDLVEALANAKRSNDPATSSSDMGAVDATFVGDVRFFKNSERIFIVMGVFGDKVDVAWLNGNDTDQYEYVDRTSVLKDDMLGRSSRVVGKHLTTGLLMAALRAVSAAKT